MKCKKRKKKKSKLCEVDTYARTFELYKYVRQQQPEQLMILFSINYFDVVSNFFFRPTHFRSSHVSVQHRKVFNTLKVIT